MTDTIREQILTALATRVAAERAPLYERLVEDTVLPVTALSAGTDGVERIEYGATHVVMTVTAERVDRLPAGVNPSSHANALLGALISAATGTDRTLGGLCEDLQYAAGSELPRESGSELAGASATFSVRYAFAIGDPFTNAL